MLRLIRDFIKSNEKSHDRLHAMLQEIEWSNVYRESIRGKPWLENLALNVGRFAGNYAFFYVLCRILNDYQPHKILEFGLGESSKVISTFLDNMLPESTLLTIEENAQWHDAFKNRFQLTGRCEVKIVEATQRQIHGHSYNAYQAIESVVPGTFDLYVIDGPKGSQRYSRYDIVTVAQSLTPENEFIILFDDYDRQGEQETTQDLIELFSQKNITIHQQIYAGSSNCTILATDKYRFAASL